MSEKINHTLAREVQKMRELQKQFFVLAAKERKMNYFPHVSKEKKRVLEESKTQEKKVDRLCDEILNPQNQQKLL